MGARAATVGIAPRLSDAELVTLAVIQALLGYRPCWDTHPKPVSYATPTRI